LWSRDDSSSLTLISLHRYKGTFFNPLFHRDKSGKELSKIYRGYKSPPIPNLDSITSGSKSPPQRSKRSSATRHPVSQEYHPPSSEEQPPATPLAQACSRESSTGSGGVGGEIADMLLYMKNTPIPDKGTGTEVYEDISPIRLLPLVQERVDSPMNDLRMLTPNGETIFSADPTMNHHSIEGMPSESRWKVFSRLNCYTNRREVDDMSDLSIEGPIRASEIFETPSASLHDLSTLPLDSLSLHTIKPSSSKWDWSSPAAKGFQNDSSEGLAPIIEALDTAFKAADPQYQRRTPPVHEHPNKQLFSSMKSEETNTTTHALLHGSCAQFSPLVPKFNQSGWAVLLPDDYSRTDDDAPAPWTGDDSTAARFLPSPAGHGIL
jgi:hypothetical protein